MKTKTLSKKAAANVKKYFQKEAASAKKLFDLCEKYGDGIHGKTHLIYNSVGDTEEFRIYNADGYCMDVSKQAVELAEDEQNDSMIEGFEYNFDSGSFEGFEEIECDEAIRLISSSLLKATS